MFDARPIRMANIENTQSPTEIGDPLQTARNALSLWMVAHIDGNLQLVYLETPCFHLAPKGMHFRTIKTISTGYCRLLRIELNR